MPTIRAHGPDSASAAADLSARLVTDAPTHQLAVGALIDQLGGQRAALTAMGYQAGTRDYANAQRNLQRYTTTGQIQRTPSKAMAEKLSQAAQAKGLNITPADLGRRANEQRRGAMRGSGPQQLRPKAVRITVAGTITVSRDTRTRAVTLPMAVADLDAIEADPVAAWLDEFNNGVIGGTTVEDVTDVEIEIDL